MSLLPRAARGHSVEPVRLEMETAFPQYPRGSFLRDYHWPVGPLRHTMVSFSAATVSFSFRRSKKFGPFRMTVSNTGVGTSVGIGGVRVTNSPRGGLHLSISAAGLTYRTRLRSQRQEPLSPQMSKAISPNQGLLNNAHRNSDDSSQHTAVVNALAEVERARVQCGTAGYWRSRAGSLLPGS
jgi:hypothetical protein